KSAAICACDVTPFSVLSILVARATADIALVTRIVMDQGSGPTPGKRTIASSVDDLADSLRRFSGFALSDAVANKSAANLAGFMALLAKIDRTARTGGEDNEGNGRGRDPRSRHGQHEYPRKRRAR